MTDLVGREDEVRSALDVVLGSAPELAVLVEGAPGIGKTTVLDVVLEAVRSHGSLVLETRASEVESGLGLLGLHDLLDPVAPDVLRMLPEPQRQRLEAALGLAAPIPGLSPDDGQLAVALVNGLRGLATRQPLVIAIDDGQWLDPSTGALLAIALRRLADAAVRVIVTARPGSITETTLSLPRVYRDRLRTIRLDGLSIGALHRLLGARLGASIPRPSLIRLHALTGGNAFHALEAGRSLGQRQWSAEALESALPSDVVTLIGHRIRDLPAAARDVVTVVAVMARPTLERVGQALQLDVRSVEEAASTAIEAGLLVEDAWGVALAHPLVGTAARASLDLGRRRALHRRLAAIAEDPDEVAAHLSLAATGPDEAVAAVLEAAADRGIARGVTIDAIEQLDRAIRLTPPGWPADLARRRVALGRALFLAGDTRRSIAELRGVDLDAIGDPSLRAEAVMLLAAVERELGRHAAAIAHLEAALAWVADPATRAELHLRLAWLTETDLAAALAHVEAALPLLAPTEAEFDYADALLARARLRLSLGLEADHDAVGRGASIQTATSSRSWTLRRATTTPVDWAVWMDDWDEARALLASATRAAEEAGGEPLLGHLIRLQLEVETWSGDLRLAAQLADAAVVQAESMQGVPAVASAQARRALVSALRGDLDAAEAEGALALATAEQIGVPPIVGYAVTALAAAARLRGDFQRVDELATRATVALDATGNVDHPAHRFHSDHLDALIALGDLDRAARLADRLTRRGRLGPRPTWSGVAERGLAAIAMAQGGLDVAGDHVARALHHHEPATIPIETARTLLVAAELERRRRRRKAAASQVAAALQVLERTGASAWSSVARSELARLGGGREASGDLTPGEALICRLAAEGLRNREIAARLGLSEKTIEAALGRAYGKLGVRSRVELAGALARVERPAVAAGGPT